MNLTDKLHYILVQMNEIRDGVLETALSIFMDEHLDEVIKVIGIYNQFKDIDDSMASKRANEYLEVLFEK